MHNFFTALSFLTRLQLGVRSEVNGEEFSASIVYFPWVGLLTGCFLAFIVQAGLYVQLPAFLLRVLLLLAELFFTGTLLLDGFMDTMDGIFSARTRERMLEIMKDSHVGANAVIGLAMLFLLKVALYLAFADQQLSLVIIALPVVTKALLVYCIIGFPCARAGGIGSLFKQKAKTVHGLLAAFFAIAVLAFLGWRFVVAGLLTWLLLTLLARSVAGQLGGLTGDTYGFLSECSGIFFLICIYFFLR